MEPFEGINHLPDEATTQDRQLETQLSSEIATLWTAHGEGKATASRTSSELKVIRQQLGEKLHSMKAVLARTGRSGGWAPFLRQHHMPRATADRLVGRHGALLHPSTNRPSEAFSAQTKEDVRQYVRRLLPKLRQMLTTVNFVDCFYDELIMQIPATGFRLVDTKT
jgi:hypothetical protein